MNALFLTGNQQLVLKQIDKPVVRQGEELIHVQIAGIGGSEYLGFKNTGIRVLPTIMGHGITGTTQENKRVAVYPLIGCKNCSYCQDGYAQLCDNWKLIGVQLNGGFAQQVVVPAQSLFEIPDTLSWEQSAFIEPFANSINAWELAHVSSEQSVLIIGAGSLGLGLVACGKNADHPNITILENAVTRKDAAMTMGAKVKAQLHVNSFDIVFDTVGSSETRTNALQLVKKNGTCLFLGFAEPSQEINFSDLIRKQIQCMGSFVFSTKQFEKAISLSALTNKNWVKNISFSEVEGQLQNYLNGDFSTIKAALRPNGVNQLK